MAHAANRMTTVCSVAWATNSKPPSGRTSQMKQTVRM